MNVGFYVMRRGYFKHFAGLVEHALARGDRVSLFCDHTERFTPRRGYKSYDFPHIEAVPRFLRGVPRVHAFTSIARLIDLVQEEAIEVLFALGRTEILEEVKAHPVGSRVLLVQVQSVPDAAILSHVGLFDRIYGFTPDWVRWSVEFLTRTGRLGEEDAARYAKDSEAIFVPTGFAEAEQLRYLDQEAARRRLGLPAGRRVLVHFPFPFVSIRHHGDWWPHRIYGQPRIVQYLNIALSGRREFLNYPHRGWNDRRVVTTLREFCDRNGALLVVKAREKNPVPGYLRRAADRVFYDECYYPATILDLLLLADLAVHFYSTAMLEAVYAGVPNVCISPSATEWPVYSKRMIVRDFSAEPDNFYNYPGVTHSVGVGEFIERFGRARFEDFPLDATRRVAFIRRFLGHEDLRTAERVFADLERHLGGPPEREWGT